MRGLLCALLVAAPMSAGLAHELPGSTATIVLRDGLVTIDANLDIRAWLSAQPAGELTAMLAAARQQAETLVVRADGHLAPMALVDFPTAQQVHRVLQRPAAEGHADGPRLVMVRWQATQAVPTARVVSARFPSAVGQVLVSFVEPRSRVAEPGAAVTFESRRPLPPQTPAISGQPP